jgi:tRNA(Ile)-lysidine synthetase-like protein
MKIASSLFFQHAERFLLNQLGACPSEVAVAVSGGVDSMLLLDWAAWMKQKGRIQQCRVFFVHHNTRAGQDQDQALVQQRCLELQLECVILRRPAGWANEEQLRRERHQLLKQSLLPREGLLMAHHLDDSWEWSELQRARSSEVLSCLGIPLKNGPVVRPFLCVTKTQIYREARRRHLRWREDPTNTQDGYARFLFRRQWAPHLQQLYPQYLKHYARRSQRTAEALGVALIRGQSSRAYYYRDSVLFTTPPRESELVEAIKFLSRQHRGSLSREVAKILLAQQAGRRGPFLLSGQVQVAIYGEWLWVYRMSLVLPDKLPAQFDWQWMTRPQLQVRLQKHLHEASNVFAPCWLAFDPEQKHRNILVASGYDAVWPRLTGQSAVQLISCEKLLQRWRKHEQKLRLAPLW